MLIYQMVDDLSHYNPIIIPVLHSSHELPSGNLSNIAIEAMAQSK